MSFLIDEGLRVSSDLNLVKKYLRLEPDEADEDDLIWLMVDNARIYMEDAGVILNASNKKMMKKAEFTALVLVLDFYENRELTTKVSEKRRDIIQGLIMQLKYCYRSDTIET